MRWLNKARMGKFFQETLKPILVVIVVACTFRSAIADWNDVPTGSMKPTILEGDRILVNKLAYDLRIPFTRWRLVEWDTPSYGDIVVFFSPDKNIRMVKRVVGVPGDVLRLRNNQLYVNGKRAAYHALDDEIIRQIDPSQRDRHRFAFEAIEGEDHPIMLTPGYGRRRSFPTITVPADHYFVMGDSRDNSRDSRWFGFVSSESIVGRTTRVALSLDPSHWFLPRWDRLLMRLP